MKFLKFIFVGLALSFCLVSYAKKEDQSWKAMMTSFISPLQSFYSLDLDKKNFSRSDKKVLKSVIKKFQKTSSKSKMKKITVFSEKDPAIKFKYNSFLNSLKYAENNLKDNPSKSVFYLKSAIDQCASCHSNGGPSTEFFAYFKNKKIPLKEQGRLALALRDFNSSTGIYKKLSLEKKNQGNLFELKDYVTSYLNSAILNDQKKADVLKTLSLVKKGLGKNSQMLKLNDLISDVNSYKKINSLEHAQKLMEEIHNNHINVEERLYTVLNIKNYIHSNLSKKDKARQAKSYMTLGDIYNGLSDISTFMIPEENYELCIHTHPHSKVAKNCFNKYVTSVVLGYSGSSGINIPYFEKIKIEDLRKLAH